jgi:hypothetical protein
MKNLLKIVSIIALTVITQTAYSAAVTDTFTTGDTLTAEKLNKIKDAVNDNDTRISGIVLTPGPVGVTGATGSQGLVGPTGAAGATGTAGDTGAVGATGTAGAKGDTGTDGIQGATGAVGTAGSQGLVGLTGAAGATGTAGAKGDTGTDGIQGATGAVGTTGSQGLIGLTGAAGATGTAGTNGATGPTGPAGLGAVVFSSAPTVYDDVNSPYSVGTVWIDTSAAKPYILVDSSAGAAVWTVFGGSATGSPYAIGDTGPAGGIVFYITDGGLHGLEAATVDQVSTQWGCGFSVIPGAYSLWVGSGELNTSDIISGCNETTAASVASAYGPGWYLPSIVELDLLFALKVSGVVGGFDSKKYWSSTQIDSFDAYLIEDDSLISRDSDIKAAVNGVRAVRSF